MYVAADKRSCPGQEDESEPPKVQHVPSVNLRSSSQHLLLMTPENIIEFHFALLYFMFSYITLSFINLFIQLSPLFSPTTVNFLTSSTDSHTIYKIPQTHLVSTPMPLPPMRCNIVPYEVLR